MATRGKKEEQAVYQVFCALRDLKPEVLRELRDGDDPAQWGARHLPSDPIIDYAQRLHAYWAEHPRAGQRLDIVFLPTIRGSYREYTKAERRWLDAVRADPEPWFVPMPDSETLNSWLKRAEELYRKREKLIGAPRFRKRTERSELVSCL